MAAWEWHYHTEGRIMERNNRIRNLVLVAVGAFALFLAFDGMRLLGSFGFGPSPEVRNYATRQLVPMDGQRFRDVMAEARGKPVLMFIYASWCPWCKKQFPMVEALERRFSKELHVAYIAIDKDALALSRYLMEHYPTPPPFTAYHVAPEHIGDFYGTLANHGFTHSGTVPYLILADRDGRRAEEFRGLTDIPTLLQAIRKAM